MFPHFEGNWRKPLHFAVFKLSVIDNSSIIWLSKSDRKFLANYFLSIFAMLMEFIEWFLVRSTDNGPSTTWTTWVSGELSCIHQVTDLFLFHNNNLPDFGFFISTSDSRFSAKARTLRPLALNLSRVNYSSLNYNGQSGGANNRNGVYRRRLLQNPPPGSNPYANSYRSYGMLVARLLRGALKLRYLVLGGAVGGGAALSNVSGHWLFTFYSIISSLLV